METNPVREVSVKIVCTTVKVDPDGPIAVNCLGCRNSLEIHQPDADLPERMLATCNECETWHIIECLAGSDYAVVIGLPTIDDVMDVEKTF